MADTVNIAPAPGLPDILFGEGVVPAVPMTADDPAALAAFGPPVWGVFSDGVPVVVADTVLEVAYTKAYSISDFPVENGAFASYDSVEAPFEGRLRFAAGGSSPNRQALIDSVESVLGDLNTYDIVTPDKVYINANVNREEYRRTNEDGGGSMLTIEVAVQEIRILPGDAMSSNTADPASASQQDGGTVQAIPANNAQIAAMGGTPITTPATLGGGMNGPPVVNPSAGGIGSA